MFDRKTIWIFGKKLPFTKGQEETLHVQIVVSLQLFEGESSQFNSFTYLQELLGNKNFYFL